MVCLELCGNELARVRVKFYYTNLLILKKCHLLPTL